MPDPQCEILTKLQVVGALLQTLTDQMPSAFILRTLAIGE